MHGETRQQGEARETQLADVNQALASERGLRSDAERARVEADQVRLLAVDYTNDCCLSGYGQQAAPWFSRSNPIPPGVKAVFERIIELHPTVLFILRFLAFSPDLPQVAFMNATNDTDKVTCPGAGNFPPKSAVCNPMNTITPKFAEVTASRVATTLAYFDELFPGRIAGVDPNALHTSEWMLMAESAFDWMPDYADEQEQAFCASRGPGCSLPLPSARVKPAFSDSFASSEAVEMNLFQARMIATAIGQLASAAKNVSDGKILTLSFYGYDLLTAEQLLNHSDLDGICSVYSYSQGTRNITGPFLPVIQLNALAAAGKLAVPEDDTRTPFAEPGCPTTGCLPDMNATSAMMRRNLLTAYLHGAAVYQYENKYKVVLVLVRATRNVVKLEEQSGLPVLLQDERLSSVEAEARLKALGLRWWQYDKGQVDAMAAMAIAR